jgi:hypothetical protein
MTKVVVAGFVICVIASMVSLLTAQAQDAKPLKEQLLGTWERELPQGFKQIKHVTQSHFTWIIYNRDDKASVADAGGTWSVRNDSYTERIEFASESHKELRGKEYTFTSKVKGDQWSVMAVPGSDIDVNEVWKRAK